jgi:hypothetical protein
MLYWRSITSGYVKHEGTKRNRFSGGGCVTHIFFNQEWPAYISCRPGGGQRKATYARTSPTRQRSSCSVDIDSSSCLAPLACLGTLFYITAVDMLYLNCQCKKYLNTKTRRQANNNTTVICRRSPYIATARNDWRPGRQHLDRSSTSSVAL